jgi:hypothetical protein
VGGEVTNLLQDGATWLGQQLKAVAGVTVTYTRGINAATGLTGTVTMARYETVDSEGFGVVALSRDYVLHAADLVVGGTMIVPRAGDQITETILGVAQTFEVMALGELRESEPLDTDGLMLLVHTKKVN